MADKRERFLGSLDRNVRALHSLLEDVTSLARLQGGQEVRIVAVMDVGRMMRDLMAAMESLAHDRGLSLLLEGPHEFQVDGDAVKIRRVVSNLLLNALRYTVKGGVTLRWGADPRADAPRWFVEVEDTGPGFQLGPTTPLAGAISIASGQANDLAQAELDGAVVHVTQAEAPAVTAPAQEGDRRTGGEGIGLSIVKRLCTLLDATIEIDSQLHRGTKFTILLPLRYDA
jgi:signal transduction histidine kinase